MARNLRGCLTSSPHLMSWYAVCLGCRKWRGPYVRTLAEQVPDLCLNCRCLPPVTDYPLTGR